MILYMYIAPGQGLTIPWGRNFFVNRNFLSLRVFVASVKKISLTSDFMQFFVHCFIHVYSPGAGADSAWGQSFDVNKNVLSLHSFVGSLKKISSKSDFIICFIYLIRVHSPRAGTYSPQETKFWCQQVRLVTSFICCKFQNNVFEVWFYTIF